MNKRKWLIGGVLVVTVGGLAWYNVAKVAKPTSAAAANVPKNAPSVKVVPVLRQDLTQTVSAPGVLEATGAQELRAPFSSSRVHLLVGIGERVKAGQVIAELVSDSQSALVAGQEAAVARAEAVIAQNAQRAKIDPLTLAQKYESAKAMLIQAEQGLLTADSSAKQQVDQARSGLQSVQSRSASLNTQVEQARNKLQEAETAYRAKPRDIAARAAYDQARTAYESALRSSTDSARQLALDLTQAQESLRVAEEKTQGQSGAEPAAVQQARSTLESARQAMEAAKAELNQGGTPAEQFRSAAADLQSARESLAVARTKLAQAQLKAPYDGMILNVALKDGQPVQESQLLFEMGVVDTLTIKARADEVDVVKLQPGQELSVKSNAFLQDRFPGTVSRVAAAATVLASAAGGSTYYEVQGLVQNPDGKLRAGMNGEAAIKTDARTGVIVIGLESLREEGDNAFVLVVKANKVLLRPVKLGLRTQTHAEITAGLNEGEQVIISPFTLIRSLKDGTMVRVEAGDQPAKQ
ncbi:MAG: hypothetical protein JWN15_469 [Firmicutes bacterium]|nr:hypothetical protein [Bacillota bacterium]